MYLEKFNKLPLANKILVIVLFLFCLLIVYAAFMFVSNNLMTKNYKTLSKDTYQAVGLGENLKGMDFGISPSAAPMRESMDFAEDDAMPISPESQRKVIKTGNLGITVNDVEQSVSRITADTSASGGFIQNSSITENTQGIKNANLVLRVPADNFESLISKIKTGAKIVTREDINGREVTEEFTDLQASLKHNQAVEAQYLELLKQANEVEEIIAVRNKLDQLQGEIERLKGRLRYLENQTEMSTITVYITSEVKITLPTGKWQPWENTKESARLLIVSMQNFVDWTVESVFRLISLIPYLIILLLIYLIAKKIYKGKFKQNI